MSAQKKPISVIIKELYAIFTYHIGNIATVALFVISFALLSIGDMRRMQTILVYVCVCVSNWMSQIRVHLFRKKHN